MQAEHRKLIARKFSNSNLTSILQTDHYPFHYSPIAVPSFLRTFFHCPIHVFVKVLVPIFDFLTMVNKDAHILISIHFGHRHYALNFWLENATAASFLCTTLLPGGVFHSKELSLLLHVAALPPALRSSLPKPLYNLRLIIVSSTSFHAPDSARSWDVDGCFD